MLQKIFNTDLNHAYEACKTALREYRCEEVFGDYRAGVIEAMKRSNFHENEKILIRLKNNGGAVISISISKPGEEDDLWNRELWKLQESMVLELISLKLT